MINRTRLGLCAVTVLFQLFGFPPASRADYPILSSVDLSPYGNTVCIDLAFYKGIVYTSSQANSGTAATLHSVDVLDPHNLRYLTSGGYGGSKAYGIKIADDTLFVASWSAGMRVFCLPGTGEMQYLWSYCPPNDPVTWDVDVYRQRAYPVAADYPDTQDIWGIRILDISDPLPPNPNNILVSRLVTDDRNIKGIVVRGGYAFYTDGLTFEVGNISDELNPYIMASRNLPDAYCLEGLCLREDYAYVYGANGTPGFVVYDILDPANPVEVTRLNNVSVKNAYLLGNHAFLASGGGGLITLDISNPGSPTIIDHTHVDSASDARVAWEQSVTGNGPYIYVGTMEEFVEGPNTSYRGMIYALQAFDDDPDDEGPCAWSDISIGAPSWDTQYTADSLPSAASPAWKLVEGSEAWASADAGVLRVADTGTASNDKVKWSRNWDVTNTRGGTVQFRARCASYDPGQASYQDVLNLSIEDGKYREEFGILPDRIRANHSNLEFALNGTAWHTYRITTQGGQFKLYVDDAEQPALEANLSSTTSRARVMFGAFSSLARQDIFFDDISCCSTEPVAPTPPLSTVAPSIQINVADTAVKGSLSGIAPATATVRWSTDGGATWTSSGSEWEAAYEGNELPSASAPPWAVFEGTETLATVSDGTLCVNDNSTASGSKIKWSRDWRAVPSRGTTVLARIRCTAAGGDVSYLNNLVVEDGVHFERFSILPDRIQAGESGLIHTLDATTWHTYRVTTLGATFRLYIDEQPTAVLTGAMTAASSQNRVWFGSGASPGTQTIYFDYVHCIGREALPPGQGDGGGQVQVTCTGSFGTDKAVVTTSEIPFNQHAAMLNKVQFSLKDGAGNLGFSPVYTVRIGRLASSDRDNDHDVDQTDFGLLQACLSGQDVALPPGCTNADLDAQGDVDEDDVQLFLECMNGPGVAMDERCAN